MKKNLGRFYIGNESITLSTRPGNGGEFYFCHSATNGGRIFIGLGYDHFDRVVSVFLHEVVEYALARNLRRYTASEDWSNDHSSYIFLLTHVEFSDIMAKVAPMIAEGLPVLRKAWDQYQKDLSVKRNPKPRKKKRK